MPLLRLLLIAVVLWIIFRLIKRVIGPPKDARPRQMDYEEMVRCAHCGIHLPRSNALVKAGKSYCNEEHAEADRQSGG